MLSYGASERAKYSHDGSLKEMWLPIAEDFKKTHEHYAHTSCANKKMILA